MTNTFTTEHRNKLEQYLETHRLPSGLGSEESACSIAAINLALSGELTDSIPDCMSNVLGKTTIKLQDAMPDEMRNNSRYKKLLPDMAGTGRELEKERLAILLDWMWSVVLPKLQTLADKHGFGTEWRNMCEKRTSIAADAASAASAAAYAAYAAAYAAYAAARDASDAAASYAASSYAASSYAASAAARAADASVAAAYATYDTNLWNEVDPIGVLERMTYLKGETDE